MQVNNKYIFTGLSIALLLTCIAAIVFGAVPISLSEMGSSLMHLLQGKGGANIHENVFLQIRLPRVLLCGIVGASLAVSGVLMQGLFRNPIVEPGLLGTSAGAAFGASLVFVLAANMSADVKAMIGPTLVPLFACIGALLATYLVYTISKSMSSSSITNLLLVGVAINAIGLSATGFMSYIARDPQARSITFWNLGTFSGASWVHVCIVGAVSATVIGTAMRYSKHLNSLLLGEEEATYLGVDVKKLQVRLMVLNTIMIAVATAFVGVISFMGLIVPHVMRLLLGGNHKTLIPASAIAGALLLLLADMGARLLLAPAEIPIGIITSLVGAPVFVGLLKRTQWLQGGADA
jgi:iron complex transport system permease protein